MKIVFTFDYPPNLIYFYLNAFSLHFDLDFHASSTCDTHQIYNQPFFLPSLFHQLEMTQRWLSAWKASTFFKINSTTGKSSRPCNRMFLTIAMAYDFEPALQGSPLPYHFSLHHNASWRCRRRARNGSALWKIAGRNEGRVPFGPSTIAAGLAASLNEGSMNPVGTAALYFQLRVYNSTRPTPANLRKHTL